MREPDRGPRGCVRAAGWHRVVGRLVCIWTLAGGALGISAGSPALHRALNLPRGVALVQVAPGGPAARAGLQPFRRGSDGSVVQGDVITAINEEAVGDLDEMLAQLERRNSGDAVTLTVWRAGQTRRQPVTLASGD